MVPKRATTVKPSEVEYGSGVWSTDQGCFGVQDVGVAMNDRGKTMSYPSDHDAYAPPEIAARVSSVGVAKATRDVASTFVLAVLAGAFIALGSLFYAVVVTGSELGFGPTRLLGGLAFSLGLSSPAALC